MDVMILAWEAEELQTVRTITHAGRLYGPTDTQAAEKFLLERGFEKHPGYRPESLLFSRVERWLHSVHPTMYKFRETLAEIISKPHHGLEEFPK